MDPAPDQLLAWEMNAPGPTDVLKLLTRQTANHGYNVVQKRLSFLSQLRQILVNVKNSFTEILSSKFLHRTPVHVTCIILDLK